MSEQRFDHIVIGAGAAGSNVVLAIYNRPGLQSKRTLVIDSQPGGPTGKTWCFWEKGKGVFEPIVQQRWTAASFVSDNIDLDLSLAPYEYKMIPSQSLQPFVKEQVISFDVTWLTDEVIEVVEESGSVLVRTKSGAFRAGNVLDSRPPVLPENYRHVTLLQHFKGVELTFDEDVFDPSRFTMMDYRLQWKDSCSFTYVLPYTKRTALVEFTFFNKEVVDNEVYDRLINQYVRDYISDGPHRSNRSESGIIPMTTFPFHEANTPHHIKIGTAGGWVKPSTGYSFANSIRYASKLAIGLETGAPLHREMGSKRHRFYDLWFTDILSRNNSSGKALFEKMYSKNPLPLIFKFLDEETSFPEELGIMARFSPLPFIKSIYRQLIGKTR